MGATPTPTCAIEGTGEPVLVAYGAGTNSTAVLVGMAHRGERPDAVVFADTGGETPETYAYLHTVEAWLAARGWPALVRVRRMHNDGETLEANCLRYGKLPGVAYGVPTCSVEWKRRPQERWVREWSLAREAWGRGQPVVKVLGFDADEGYRVARIESDRRYRHRFPLIEWGWGREECIEAIEGAGLPLPGKSSCFFCPNRRPADVVRLSESHPPLFARALAMEDAARAEDERTGQRSDIVGLARKVTWRDIVDGDRRQAKLWTPEMPCGCYDGDEGAA